MTEYSRKFNVSDHKNDNNGVLHLYPYPDHNDPVGLIADAVLFALEQRLESKRVNAINIHGLDKGYLANQQNLFATLTSSLIPQIDLKIQFDGNELKFRDIDMEPHLGKIQGWLERIDENLRQAVPTRPIDDPSFVWYHTVTANSWSGRIEGLEVIATHKNPEELNVGHLGVNGNISDARRIFLAFQETHGRDAKALLSALVEDRRLPVNESYTESAPTPKTRLSQCEREHHMESRILRGDLVVRTDNDVLETVNSTPFQFPTLWSWQERENPRYVDALMKAGDTPYVLELKVNQNSQGEYYRHAVTQVVLYREFIRKATSTHGWFTRQGLDATKCEAAVVLPEGTQEQYLEPVRQLAKAWGVLVTHPTKKD